MLKLSREDRKQLRNALVSGYRRYSRLKIFVSDNFEFGLNEVVSSKALKIAADELIEVFLVISEPCLDFERSRGADGLVGLLGRLAFG